MEPNIEVPQKMFPLQTGFFRSAGEHDIESNPSLVPFDGFGVEGSAQVGL